MTPATYAPSHRPEFSAIELPNRVIYHQRGSYSLSSDDLLIPVNRSYRPLTVHEGHSSSRDAPYIADKLIHDTVPETAQLLTHEVRLRVLGKTLLFLSQRHDDELAQEYDSMFDRNPGISAESRQVLELIHEGLSKRNQPVQIGLHGSHGVNLNGADSDMDLVAWANRDARADALTVINEVLIKNGYIHANTTSKINEYAVRISNLTGLPLHLGYYLALQRNRWISPRGTGTSMQLVHMDYNHDATKSIVEDALNGEYEYIEEIRDCPVELLDNNEPFNYPRLWSIAVQGHAAKVLSFNMVHQGMGTDGKSAEANVGAQALTASKFRSTDGSELYFLKDDSHYLLPLHLIA